MIIDDDSERLLAVSLRRPVVVLADEYDKPILDEMGDLEAAEAMGIARVGRRRRRRARHTPSWGDRTFWCGSRIAFLCEIMSAVFKRTPNRSEER